MRRHTLGATGLTSRLAANLALIFVGVVFLVPLAWLVLASLDSAPSAQIAAPRSITLKNFAEVFTWELGIQPLINSLLLSLGSSLVTVIVALLASYPLSRYQMRFNQPFLYTVLLTSCLPMSALMVPVFSLAVRAGVLDSLPVTALFMSATALPMAIWMTKNFMDSVPIVLEEAAWTDGASRLHGLWRVVVPLMQPGVAVVFIYVFMQAWGNFFVPFLLLRSRSKHPAAVTIYQFFGQYGAINYGMLAAFSILYALPAIFLYLLVSQKFGASFAGSGAVKG
uniref:carbohydrate ABC transporter permease n=1 Tax=Tessaracoccus timonensis TaxID=2161816 RepID=UPI000D5503A0|nr:carbohydrate ABC transporter permease [Tessaracoccus timonensis]